MIANEDTEVKLRITILASGKHVTTQVFTQLPVLFGRDSVCELSLQKWGYLSRTHGSIGLIDGKILVCDLDSRNGITGRAGRVKSIQAEGECVFKVGELEFHVSVVGTNQPKSWIDQRVQEVVFEQIETVDLTVDLEVEV